MSNQDIINAAYLYLDGISLRKIAEKLNFSHVTIHYNLTKTLKDLDYELWSNVNEKLYAKKIANSIDDENVIKRILIAYKLLIANNLTVKEIALSLNESEFTIYRDLTKRLSLLVQKYPDKFSIYMVNDVQRRLTEHSFDNLRKEGRHL